MTVRVPERLLWLRRMPGGAARLDSLPAEAERLVMQWELDAGSLEQLPVGYVSLVLGCRTLDGADVVLKLPYPHEEAGGVRDRRPWLLDRRDARSIVEQRVRVLSAGAGLDPERVRGWSLVHALAWGMDDGARYDDVLACIPLLGA